MAILYGTTADGESLPVEVNELGQLVAQGLAGPPGPPGPPGVGQLPPDPFEGAILGWKDNALAWLGGSVPLPAGTYGPIVLYGNGIITLEESISLPYGTEIFLSDNEGNRYFFTPVTSPITRVDGFVLTLQNDKDLDKFRVGDVVQSTPGWNQSEEWSSGLITNPPTGPWANAFDSDEDTQTFTYNNSVSTLEFPVPVNWTSSIEVLALRYGGGLFINGVDITAQIPGFDDTKKWHRLDNIVGSSGALVSVGVSDVGSNYTALSLIKLDGALLVDASIPDPNEKVITAIDPSVPSITTDGAIYSPGQVVTGPVKSGTGSVQSTQENSIILRANNDEWCVGQYVTTPQQAIAARYVVKEQLRRKKSQS